MFSPSDEPDLLRLKLVNYLTAGAEVWVVKPDNRTVELYTPGRKGYRLTADDTLDGGEWLPGFNVPVREIFPTDADVTHVHGLLLRRGTQRQDTGRARD